MADTGVKARKRKKRERTVSRLGEPVMRGKAYVGNDLVDEVAKLKEVILFQDRVGPVQVHKNGSHNKFLDKVWVFAPYQKLEAVKERAFDCIEPGRKSILTVLTSNNHVTRNLFAFSIKSQFVSKPSKLKTEKLTLAFETKEEAQIWLDHVANQLATIRRKQKPSMDQGLSHLVVDNDSSEDGTEAQDQTPHAPDSMNHLTETQDQARINSDSGAERPVELPIQRSVFLSDPETPIRADNIGSHEIDSTTDGGMATPRGHGSLFDEEEDDAASLDERAVSLENLHAELRADSYIGADFYNWTVVRTNNNVTVLRGSGEHNAKSIMVSYIIRAPPRLCVKTVLKRDHHDIQKAQTTMHSEVIQTIDPFNDMLETTWRPSGIGALFLIPRKLIVQRLWRREDDGTYVIVFKSVEEQCEDRASLSRWLAPCIQMDSVMTFSPLTSEYCKTEESTETLVTVTSDLGSFKGMWHVRNPLEWLLKALYPFPFSHISSYIESVIEQSVAVRTRAEAARFSVKPFLGSQDSDIAERISNPLSSPSTSQPSTLPQIPPLPQIPENQTTRDLVRNMVKESRERVTREDPDFTSPVSSFATASVTFAEPEQGAQVEPSSKSDTSALPPVPREEESGNESTTEESEKPALTPEDVATCDKKYWLCVGHNKLKVRGKDYLTDKKKIPADDPVFQLVATDLMQVDQPTPHIARFLPSLKHSKAPFTFIMQIMFGHPSLSLTFSWAAPDPDSQRHLSRKLTKAMSRDIEPDSQSDWNAEEDDLHDKPFELTLARFLAGSTTDLEANKRRDGVVKLIPQISKGPWIVKQAVGTTPCLLGRKLNALYHRGPGYFEVDVDVNSSSVAANIVGIVQGVTKKLWVDMAIVLEGHSIEELPEVLLGSVRCAHLDLNSAKLLDTTTGEIRDKPGYE